MAACYKGHLDYHKLKLLLQILVTDKLSFGLALIGDRFSEERFIRYAYACEKSTEAWKQGRQLIQPKTEIPWEGLVFHL